MMKLNNEMSSTKNQRTLKYANFYHHRKSSQEGDSNRKIFEQLDSFSKEAVPLSSNPKNVGKIKRNSSNSGNEPFSKKKANDQNYASEQKAIDQWMNEQLISKIRCSQLISQPQKSSFSILKESSANGAESKSLFKRNTRSVSSHYETQYANLVSEYQKKKEKINHEIQSLRKTQKLKLQKVHQKCPFEDATHNMETPKFGTNSAATQRMKSIRSVSTSKVAKDEKCITFLTSIKMQMEMQEKLRKLKHEIQKSDQQQIAAILRNKYGIQQNITILDCQEFDPFTQPQGLPIQTIAAELADSYLAAEQSWSKNIKSSFNLALLNDIFTSFESEKERGTISLKGFVRQIGVMLQNEKYLRNRDLYRIHKRIQPFTRDNFLATLRKTEPVTKN